VTNNKRINRDLLRKESSFVCCISSVLYQIDSIYSAKNAKTPPLVTSPTENPKPKIKTIFFNLN